MVKFFKVDKRKQENRMKKDELNDKYLELVEKERLYYKQVKEFTEVFIKVLLQIT